MDTRGKTENSAMAKEWTAIAVATLIYTVLGYFWYGPMMFLHDWSKQMGIIVLGDVNRQWYTVPAMVVIGFLYSMGLTRAIKVMNLKGITGGMLGGLAMIICYILMANSAKLLFTDNNRIMLFWIDFGFQSIAGLLMGAVLGKAQE